MKFNTSKEPLSMFSYSSLTDIVMLLLIFFLLTSQFVIQTGVKVQLPGSKTNEQSTPTKLIVTLTAGGVVYLGNEEVAIEELPAKINVLKGTLLEENLIIRADKTVAVDLVIKVIDAARASGIEKFTIETEKQKL
ncbi:MAG: biopolymer transporter [Ignavibacteria bacterium CG2_30_36_16]|nr:biopolymer transporter ExbD [Ignavibacteria bacterium]OIP57053.1 MAG: biopolymer transporter [Ignavibacteria bacterium CG2_30_36_16]PJB01307.1 MAG: biopolymer transporter ExbD [Ignavibacteria bacterium CG_4_9_14_3_um_filter_36_18]